eukprot:TRINITY_DN5656_c0_g1_i1.p2 TRINITY_DN5656_c0_g1~~TRINITY_DN5656_c0_g1_i1.p2  ORF type:complete len:248 (-),score=60.56 TRINITY_DN5656_c0_g1_i1:140-883(-)
MVDLLINLGLLYFLINDLMMAVNYFEKSLQIQLKLFGDPSLLYHPDVSSFYFNISYIYFVMNEYQLSLEYLCKYQLCFSNDDNEKSKSKSFSLSVQIISYLNDKIDSLNISSVISDDTETDLSLDSVPDYFFSNKENKDILIFNDHFLEKEILDSHKRLHELEKVVSKSKIDAFFAFGNVIQLNNNPNIDNNFKSSISSDNINTNEDDVEYFSFSDDDEYNEQFDEDDIDIKVENNNISSNDLFFDI